MYISMCRAQLAICEAQPMWAKDHVPRLLAKIGRSEFSQQLALAA
jgi:hypothetical protein